MTLTVVSTETGRAAIPRASSGATVSAWSARIGDGQSILNSLQMLADEELMMRAHATVQCIGKLRLPCSEPRAAELGQLDRIGLASDNRLQDAPSAHPQDVRDHRRQLDIGFLEHGLNALGVLHDLVGELLPSPRQIAQLLDRLRWHETRPDQTMR